MTKHLTKQDKPVIGITVSRGEGCLKLSFGCEEAVLAAGGLPLALPLHLPAADAAALLARCDGLLLSGGVDVDPARYGEEVLPACGAIDGERDDVEAAFYAAARSVGMPVLGICRGHQAINVFEGGDLYQDIDAQFVREHPLQHASAGASDTLLHTVQPLAGSLLAQLCGMQPLRVSSTHHQAVRRLGKGLRVCAQSRDGVIEALEGTQGGFLLGVQWHPELRYAREAHALALFRGLVEAAGRWRAARP